MLVPSSHCSQLRFREPSFLVSSLHVILWQAGYSHFLRRPEKIDLLQCYGLGLSRNQRIWAAAFASDSGFRLHLAVLRESFKQTKYCIMKDAVADGAAAGLHRLEGVSSIARQQGLLDVWVKDVIASFQAFHYHFICQQTISHWTFNSIRAVFGDEANKLLGIGRFFSPTTAGTRPSSRIHCVGTPGSKRRCWMLCSSIP